jgi:MFS family permease
MMEGGFIGVVAAKIFAVHPAVLALISAAPMFGNLSSFLWARLAQGRRKVPYIVALQAIFVAFVACVALAPVSLLGTWILVGSLIAARLVLGGVLTVRSLVWTLNYPREARGRITARLSILTSLTIVVTSLAGSLLLDADASLFRVIYAGGALFAGIGVVAFSGVPLLGEERQLSLERGLRTLRDPRAAPGTERSEVAPKPSSPWGVLRHDKVYAEYLGWQFLLGISNMMVEAPLIYLLSVELGASYTASIGLTLVVPMALSVITIPLWAGYIDRVHISEFRSRHSWFFAASQLFLWLGAVQGSLWLIALARVILGLARGGGSLAWQLGHNDFADQERLGLYMGVHVTLTGLRGAFAPFLGMLLYVGWASRTLPGVELTLPAFEGAGAWVMLAACVLSSGVSLGFLSLHRRLARRR